ELDFDVAGPVILKNDYSYYGGNDSSDNDKHPGAMIAEACKGVDSTIDFSQYDWDGDGEVEQVYVVYAGQGEANGGSEDTVWPHQWGLAYNDYGSVLTLDGVTINTYACGAELGGEEEIDGIGTFCHEFSHCLGFPDMYDTRGNNFGMGTWDLMDYGSYNDDGFVPSEYTSYEKWAAGWLEPIVLADDEMEVTNMKALSEGGEAYVIYNKANSDEFYLLENRQLTGWDAGQYGNGLLVLHVDYDANVWANNKVNTVATRQRCTIFHADNSDEFTVLGLRNDPYPSGANDSLTNKSVPAATLYNANDNGKKYMNVSITNIKRNGDGTMSFNYKPLTSSQGNYLFRETFDDCNGTGGNDGLWSGTIASNKFTPDNQRWTANSDKSYGGDQCAKFGTSSVIGTATTPEFTVNGTATFTFKAAPFGSDGKTLKLSTSNSNVTISPSTFTMNASKWTDFTATLTGTGNVKVTFTPAKRLFLDEVMADDPTATAIKELPTVNPTVANGRIYTIDGRFVGTDFSVLKKGIYIVDGKKVVIK
ncbi:MAG: M6 family metalloprotease domain-containing protein, partial [Prevotella sp.]|nr:M6 family metalloprotease domain-containing protein [Prevotella sp.]